MNLLRKALEYTDQSLNKAMQAAPQKEAIGFYQCQRCGNCCKWPGFVRLMQSDMERIASYLEMELPDFVAKYTDLHPSRQCLMFKNTESGACIMYDEEQGGCRVHAVKPFQCIGFPNTWNFPGWEKICEAIFIEKKDE